MTEFHKKESEELEKEHDKLYETLDEDRKKVRIVYRVLSPTLRTINYTKLLMRIEKRYVGFPFVNVVSSVQLKAFSDTVIF